MILLKVNPVNCFLFSALIFTACNHENWEEESNKSSEQKNSKTYQLVDSALWPHFETFEQVAFKRGIDLDLRELEVTGAISDIPEANVAGTCRYGTHIHQVTIDRSYWNSASHLQREMVVFHELGHCVLAISHRESDNGEGLCLSIMNSGTTNCRVAYTSQNREYYLDELFKDVN